MIRIDSIWLATEPMDMRTGTETALAKVVAVFGARHDLVLGQQVIHADETPVQTFIPGTKKTHRAHL